MRAFKGISWSAPHSLTRCVDPVSSVGSTARLLKFLFSFSSSSSSWEQMSYSRLRIVKEQCEKFHHPKKREKKRSQQGRAIAAPPPSPLLMRLHLCAMQPTVCWISAVDDRGDVANSQSLWRALSSKPPLGAYGSLHRAATAHPLAGQESWGAGHNVNMGC